MDHGKNVFTQNGKVLNRLTQKMNTIFSIMPINICICASLAGLVIQSPGNRSNLDTIPYWAVTVVYYISLTFDFWVS